MKAHLPAIVIGVGLGGFFDGIVPHQLLQWHHLASNVVPPDSVEGLELNYFLDGLFHQAIWLVTLAGVVLLYRELVGHPSAAHPRPSLAGGILIGFGAFNVADSIAFHWLLDLHNIRPGPDWLMYDLAYFGWGVAMVGAGSWRLARVSRSARRGPGPGASHRAS